jgi:hypothetical protein
LNCARAATAKLAMKTRAIANIPQGLCRKDICAKSC